VPELPNAWLTLIPLGVCAGLISGALGLGSGTVFVPAMVLLLGFPQKSAQGTALAVMIPMALVGAIRYKLNPDIPVNIVYVGWLVLGAVSGALIGVRIASHLPAAVLRRVFAVFIILIGIRMMTIAPEPKPVSPDAGADAAASGVLNVGKEK